MTYDDDVLQTIAMFLDRAGASDEDKSQVLACAWILQQVPEVKNEEQAENYRRHEKALIEQWLAKEGAETYDDFMRGRAGMLVSAYRARVGQWDAAPSKFST